MSGWRDFVPGEVLTAANVQDYLMDQSVMTFASVAARTAALTSPTEGMVSYLSDDNIVQVFTGSSWVTIADDNGLPIANGGTGATTVSAAQDSLRIPYVGVSPTSVDVSGGSAGVDPNGRVFFSAVTSVSLNGVFTSQYQSYRIVANIFSSFSVTQLFRLRAGGVNSATNYDFVRVHSNTGSGPTRSSGLNFGEVGLYGISANGRSHFSIDLGRPAEVDHTIGYSTSSQEGSSGHEHTVTAWRNYVIQAFDGFTLYGSAGTSGWTGYIQVFGINQ